MYKDVLLYSTNCLFALAPCQKEMQDRARMCKHRNWIWVTFKSRCEEGVKKIGTGHQDLRGPDVGHGPDV